MSTQAMDAAGLHGVNLEGKEQRFGVAGTVLYDDRDDERGERRGQRWSRSAGSGRRSRSGP